MKTNNQTQNSRRIIWCTVDRQVFCFDMATVASVQPHDVVTDSEKYASDPLQVGKVKIRGVDAPVISLASRLNINEGQESVRRHVVMLHVENRIWGVSVEDVSRVITIPDRQFNQLPTVTRLGHEQFFNGVINFSRDNVERDRRREDSRIVASTNERRQQNRSRGSLEIALMIDPLGIDPSNPELGATRSQTTNGELSAQAPVSTGGSNVQRRQIMRFAIAELERPLSVGLSISQIHEIMAPQPIVAVPGAPDFVKGLVNWRERPVPVIDLARRFGLPASNYDDLTRMVIATGGQENELFAFVTPATIRRNSYPFDWGACSVPETVPAQLIRGAFEVDNETMVLPELSNLLTLSVD